MRCRDLDITQICARFDWLDFQTRYLKMGNPSRNMDPLSRYYQTLAEQTERNYFDRWRDARTRRDALQTWLERAEFAQRDLAFAVESIDQHERDRARLTEERDREWQKLQANAQRQHEAELHRQRLAGLHDFLTGTAERFRRILHCPSLMQPSLPRRCSLWRKSKPSYQSDRPTGMPLRDRGPSR